MTTGLWVLASAVLLATAVALAKRWYDGRFRDAPVAVTRDDAGDEVTRLSSSDLGGAELGERATLVQFSSAFCQPCRATRRILGELAGVVPGVVHVEIDAESNLDLVRRLDVRRTPTTLVLDATGRVTTRASGAPRKEQVLSALPL